MDKDDNDKSHDGMDQSDHDSMAEGSDSKSDESHRAETATTRADARAEREMRILVLSRIMIGTILFFTAVAAGVTTYFTTSGEQVRDFEIQFEDFAQEIIDVAEDVLSTVVASMNTMSSTMIGFAKSQETEWPFYTLPDYNALGDNLRNMSGAQIISWSPLVKGDENRQLWETYSAANAGSETISSKIFSYDSAGQIIEEDGQGLFAPVWQIASATSDSSTINFNLMSDDVFVNAFLRAKASQGMVLSEALDVNRIFGTAAVTEVESPRSLLVTPAYDGFSSETGLPVLVGSVVAVLPWDIFFKNIVHESTAPMYAVVDDGMCGSEFTFKITGSEAGSYA